MPILAAETQQVAAAAEGEGTGMTIMAQITST